MHIPFSVWIGKAVQTAASLRGGGSALPGLVVEKLDPKFAASVLGALPHGVIVVSGTNGKTTTTKMVVDLLASQGLRVFTNKTGSNFMRGVISALLRETKANGRLDADIAVLELDEAHAVHFVREIAPKHCLLLNVMRDQLDRFGEIDATAEMLRTIATHTTDHIVLNRDDPRLGAPSFRRDLKAEVRTYGVTPELLQLFPSDDSLRDTDSIASTGVAAGDDTTLRKLDVQRAIINFGGYDHAVELMVNGIYNVLNATGAVALCRAVMGDKLNELAMLQALQKVTPAFGRGESLTVGGAPCELVLVKNPGGFRLGLKSFDPAGYATMIAINDHYADGRDMSWLWDVDFASLKEGGVDVVTGLRADDMALRLRYDDVPFTSVEPDLEKALDAFLAKYPASPRRIFCTYTAMLALRKHLARITDVEKIS